MPSNATAVRSVKSFVLLLSVYACMCACSSDMSADAAMAPDMWPASCCGVPGDVAVNADGVGAYCTTTADCRGDRPLLCSAIGNDFSRRKTYFCTFLCTRGVTDCGAAATCYCNPDDASQCACTPVRCTSPPPPGC